MMGKKWMPDNVAYLWRRVFRHMYIAYPWFPSKANNSFKIKTEQKKKPRVLLSCKSIQALPKNTSLSGTDITNIASNRHKVAGYAFIFENAVLRSCIWFILLILHFQKWTIKSNSKLLFLSRKYWRCLTYSELWRGQNNT